MCCGEHCQVQLLAGPVLNIPNHQGKNTRIPGFNAVPHLGDVVVLFLRGRPLAVQAPSIAVLLYRLDELVHRGLLSHGRRGHLLGELVISVEDALSAWSVFYQPNMTKSGAKGKRTSSSLSTNLFTVMPRTGYCRSKLAIVGRDASWYSLPSLIV